MLGLSDLKDLIAMLETTWAFLSGRKATSAEAYEKHVDTLHRDFQRLARQYIEGVAKLQIAAEAAASREALANAIRDSRQERLPIVLDRNELRSLIDSSRRLFSPSGSLKLNDAQKGFLSYAREIDRFFDTADPNNHGTVWSQIFEDFAQEKDNARDFEEVSAVMSMYCEICISTLERRHKRISDEYHRFSGFPQAYLKAARL